MSSVIVFSQGGDVSLLIPADCGLSVLDIGKKDVPNDTPFWIVPRESLPDTPQNTWEIDAGSVGEPDGYGGTYMYLEEENDKN